MRRFFRFSVRDVLWLTLVVALGLGWCLRDRQLISERDRAIGLADKWRHVAGGLEHGLREAGFGVTWLPSGSEAILVQGEGSILIGDRVSLIEHQPSLPE
jgi:hypothetical protein